MGKKLIYLILISIFIITGCAENNAVHKNTPKEKQKKIWKPEKDFVINKIASKEKKNYTISDSFIQLTIIKDHQIIKSLKDDLLLAIDKDGILSHKIVENKGSSFSISPYSYIITPYTIKFK